MRATTRGICAAAFLAAAVSWGAGQPVAFAQDEGEAAVPAPTAKKAVSRQAIRRLFQVIKAEPNIRDVQRIAVKHYRLEPERIHKLARNARLKGLVPNVTARLSNDINNRFINTKDGLFPVLPSPPENPNPNGFKERTSESSDSLTWSVEGTWDLDRLVFAAESLDAKSLTSLEENLIREVTTLFFSRRRVLASLILSPPDDDEEFFYELMRLDELTATLDAFTGGTFAKKAWNWEKELVPR
jgi:hypothetical protein